MSKWLILLARELLVAILGRRFCSRFVKISGISVRPELSTSLTVVGIDIKEHRGRVTDFAPHTLLFLNCLFHWLFTTKSLHDLCFMD